MLHSQFVAGGAEASSSDEELDVSEAAETESKTPAPRRRNKTPAKRKVQPTIVSLTNHFC